MSNPFDIPVTGLRQIDLTFEIRLPTNKGRSRLFSIPVVELTQRSAAVIRGAKWNFLSVWLLRSGKSHSSTIRERKDPTMTERRSFGI